MENPVEDYFKQDRNKMKCLSVKTLSKRLNMRKKDVYFYIFNCNKLVRVKPMEVGSLASKSRVFKYCDI
tara:strand:- start:6323 stop:6529 length:207 start_codon:yes stop_codon:yes gene_type:complete